MLGYAQLRQGPNKPSFIGIPQPAADAVKLFSNAALVPYLSNSLFIFMPFLSLGLAFLLWSLVPWFSFVISYSFRLIRLLAFLSVGVYPIIIAGWSSNSKYSELGRIRNIAQTISYEVRLALVLAVAMLNIRFIRLREVSNTAVNLFLWPFLVGVWLVISIAETNRTPFDFAEGERELVSGFNTEYSRNKFAVVFIAEYASIYFLATLSTIIFLMGLTLWVPLTTRIIIFFWIWVRATLPRHRYDRLIDLNWKSFLPLILLVLTVRRILFNLYN